jgi:hypothetical protein
MSWHLQICLEQRLPVQERALLGAVNNHDKSRIWQMSRRATLRAVHSIFPPPESSGHLGSKDGVCWKKLEEGDAGSNAQKEILSHKLNGATPSLSELPETSAPTRSWLLLSTSALALLTVASRLVANLSSRPCDAPRPLSLCSDKLRQPLMRAPQHQAQPARSPQPASQRSSQ